MCLLFCVVSVTVCTDQNGVVHFLTFQMSKINHSDVHGVVKMLGRCLPHIVPNVLLAKREVSCSWC